MERTENCWQKVAKFKGAEYFRKALYMWVGVKVSRQSGYIIKTVAAAYVKRESVSVHVVSICMFFVCVSIQYVACVCWSVSVKSVQNN